MTETKKHIDKKTERQGNRETENIETKRQRDRQGGMERDRDLFHITKPNF